METERLIIMHGQEINNHSISLVLQEYSGFKTWMLNLLDTGQSSYPFRKVSSDEQNCIHNFQENKQQEKIHLALKLALCSMT